MTPFVTSPFVTSPFVTSPCALPPARMQSASWAKPVVSRLAASSSDLFTGGAIVQWWTMMSIVTADVAAYFASKRFGRTKLIELSPRKTWEGLVGGCVGAALCSTLGACLMGWPYPRISGAFYGLTCAVLVREAHGRHSREHARGGVRRQRACVGSMLLHDARP